jgi:DNA-binding SARP family transcriptional activator
MIQGGTPLVLRSRAQAPAPTGLRRERLITPLTGSALPDVVHVVAPAGCGKTTLLSHLAEGHRGPVAWLTLDPALGATDVLLAHLRLALDPVLDRSAPRTGASAAEPAWTHENDLLAALDEDCRPGALVILDDLHEIAGEPGARLPQLMFQYRPAHLRLIFASRTPTGIDISRAALTGRTLALGADDLRFRTWEVEELLRQRDRSWMRPEEVALLTRRTGGWAASLQLFDLATCRMPPSMRLGVLHDRTRSGLLTREYLTRHVVAGVRADLRNFALRTSVLRELTAQRCDAVLETNGSGSSLEQLAELGLVAGPNSLTGDGSLPWNEAQGPERTYLHHDVLRQALLMLATDEFGEAELSRLHRRAAVSLHREGLVAEAIRCYALANDWDAVGTLVREAGSELAGTPGTWLDALPATLRDSDPWVVVALARRQLADGSLHAALATYRRAESMVAPDIWAGVARDDARAVSVWLDPPLGNVDDWVALLRRAFGTPGDVLARPGRVHPPSPGHALARAAALLVAGRLVSAERLFAAVLGMDALAGPVEALALLGRALALSLALDPRAPLVRQQFKHAARAQQGHALERLAEGLDLACVGASRRIATLVDECLEMDDEWGAAILRLVLAVSSLPGPAADAWTPTLPEVFRSLGSPALATWAELTEALAQRTSSRGLVRAAEALGPLPLALASLGAGRPLPEDLRRGDAAGAALGGNGLGGNELGGNELGGNQLGGNELGGSTVWLRLISAGLPSADQAPEGGTASGDLRVHCLGGFRMLRGDRPVELAGLRPRHRELLRALCLHAGRPVHRELLMEWFWPQHDPTKAARNLQVAISAVRQVVEAAAQADDPTLSNARLRRDGSCYRLELGNGWCDVVQFHRLAADVREARAGSAPGVLEAALRALLETGTGELLPDDGAAEWVAEERDRVRSIGVSAAEELADLLMLDGRVAEAAEIARRGLEFDRYADGLWKRLISALDDSEQQAASVRAQRSYEAIVAELGVSAP